MDRALDGALDGRSVVALATNIPGPLAASRLRAMGAHVTKIEPLRGDALAAASPQWYAEIVAGMEVVRLDLRAPGDRERLDVLLSVSDLLITATRASALQRAGLTWETLHARHPKLSHVAVVGEAAPNDDRAGHDLTYQAAAGLLSPPAMPRSVFADLAAAELATSTALAALLVRDRTASGVYAQVAIVDAATSFAAPYRHGLTAPGGALGGALPAYRLYRATDGWVALAALEEHFSARLQAVLGVDRLDVATLEAAIAARCVADWERMAREHDLPLAAFTEEKR